MKVLIVSENDKTIAALKSFFKTKDGYETITYRVPIKAMDNFGEITPNLVVLSAVDFPKHWKIFMQYVNFTHVSVTCDTVLVVDKKFDAKEKEKAQTLGVWKMLSESKLHKFVASAAAGTVNFIDVVNEEDTAAAAAPEIPPEVEQQAAQIVEPYRAVQEDAPPDLDEAARLDAQFEEAFQEQEMLLERERDSILTKISPEVEPYASHLSHEEREEETDTPVDDDFEEPESAAVTEDTQETAPDDNMTPEEAEALAAALEPPKSDPEAVQFLFRHPKTGKIIPGTVETASDSSVVFRPAFQSIIATFDNGELIKSASFKNGESFTRVNALVMPWDDTLHFTIIRDEADEFAEPDAPSAESGEIPEDTPDDGMTPEEADALAAALEPPKSDPEAVQFVFRHPKTGKIIPGTVETASDSSVVFRPASQSIIATFDNGELIKSASFKNGESFTRVNALVMPWDDTLHFTIIRDEADEFAEPDAPSAESGEIPEDTPDAGLGSEQEDDVTAEEADSFAAALATPKADPRQVQFLFRHPETGALVTGIVETVTGSSIVFRPDFQTALTAFESGDLITSASFKNGDDISLVNAYVMPWDDTLHFTLARDEQETL